jgi:hypothetical protein
MIFVQYIDLLQVPFLLLTCYESSRVRAMVFNTMVMIVLGLQLLMQSVPITTNILSLNTAHVLNTTFCDKFVSDLWQVCGFLWVPRFDRY